MHEATSYAAAFNALGDPTRRAIFELLAQGPLAVVEVAEHMPVSRPAVSQHLKVLMNAGLVMVEPKGRRNHYQIDPTGVVAMRNYLDGMWDVALHAFKLAAENERKTSR
jgi:DNA-binding transcriptional ArsR family regulator